MGSTFVITAIDSSYSRASKTCQEAITYGRQIEAKISSWDENSQTSKINRYAGISPVKVDKYLFDLIARSKKISELTVGAFDISYASLDKVWDFSLDTISFPENVERLKQDLIKYVGDVKFKDCNNMGEIIETILAFVKRNYLDITNKELF